MKSLKNLKKKIKKHKFGFTMIELLVVATIIIVLSSVGLVSYRKAGESSRNAKRKADLEITRQALVLFRADNGYYPTASSTADNGLPTRMLTEKKPFFASVVSASSLVVGDDAKVDDTKVDDEKAKEGELDQIQDIVIPANSPTPVSGGKIEDPINNSGSSAYSNLVTGLISDGYLTEMVQEPKTNHPQYEYESAGNCGDGACSFTLKATLEPVGVAGVWEVKSP